MLPKLYKFIGFGAMDVAKPHKFIRFGAMDVAKLCECIRFLCICIGRSSILCRSGNCSGWPGEFVPGPWRSIPGPVRGDRRGSGGPENLIEICISEFRLFSNFKFKFQLWTTQMSRNDIRIGPRGWFCVRVAPFHGVLGPTLAKKWPKTKITI